MYQDHSFGIIPIRKQNGKWLVFLIKHRSGHWAFPKGHPEVKETPMEAATRELREESGLNVSHFWDTDPLTECYSFYSNQIKIEKTVTYFIAEVEGKVTLQLDEVVEYKWLSIEAAIETVTFPEAKSICLQVQALLQEKE